MSAGFGAFGKIPAMGDFFRVNLPPAFIQPWDEWLQGALVLSRRVLGDRWLETYFSAPIWRFTLPAGLMGDMAVSGVLMASVDRVGRQYPLTLATRHLDRPTALTHFANRRAFEMLENIALDMLEDTATKEDLTEKLATVSFVTPEPVPFALPYVGTLPAAQVLAADAIDRTPGPTALWSAMLEGNHRLLMTRGRPQGGEISALFDLAAPHWTGAVSAVQ